MTVRGDAMPPRARVPPDRRKAPRYRVQFRSSIVTALQKVKGEGLVTNLSTGGCTIESKIPVSVGAYLELKIYVPGLDHPITIGAANVRWVRKREFGVNFFHVLPAERARLHQVVQGLEISSGQVEEEDIHWH